MCPHYRAYCKTVENKLHVSIYCSIFHWYTKMSFRLLLIIVINVITPKILKCKIERDIYFNHVYDLDLYFIVYCNPILKCAWAVDLKILICIIYCLKVMHYSFNVKMPRSTFNSFYFLLWFFKSCWVRRCWLIWENTLIWLHYLTFK